MNKFKGFFLFLIIAVTPGVLTIEQSAAFIVKKSKRVTPSMLKEQIGARYGYLLKKSSQIIKIMASCSQEIVDCTSTLLEEDCKASSPQLQKYLDILAEFEQKLVIFEQTATSLYTCLEQGLPGTPVPSQ
jgi:hypothetical protein